MTKLQITIFLCLSRIALAGEADLEAVRQKYHLPAIGSLLIRDGKITSKIAGVRKVGDSTPATVDDQFHIGSCTKAMTATLLARYVEKGAIRWNETLAELFPE